MVGSNSHCYNPTGQIYLLMRGYREVSFLGPLVGLIVAISYLIWIKRQDNKS